MTDEEDPIAKARRIIQTPATETPPAVGGFLAMLGTPDGSSTNVTLGGLIDRGNVERHEQARIAREAEPETCTLTEISIVLNKRPSFADDLPFSAFSDPTEFAADLVQRERPSHRLYEALEGSDSVTCVGSRYVSVCSCGGTMVVECNSEDRFIRAKCLGGCDVSTVLATFVTTYETERVRSETESTERERHDRIVEMARRANINTAFEDVPDGPTPLIEDILPVGQLIMLNGASGARKTMTAITWGVAVASGVPWLERVVIQVRVLIVLLEGDRADHKRWLRQLAGGFGSTFEALGGRMDLYPFPLNVTDPASLAAFIAYARDLKYGLVLIDNLSEIHAGGRQSGIDDRHMITVLHPLRELVRATPGLSIVVLHHANASGDPRGGDGIVQHFDRVLDISALNDHNNAIVSIERGKGRDGHEVEDLQWRFVGGPEDDTIEMVLVGAKSVADRGPKADPRRAWMLELLPARTKEILEGMKKHPKCSNRNAMVKLRDTLEAEGVIECKDNVWFRK